MKPPMRGDGFVMYPSSEADERKKEAVENYKKFLERESSHLHFIVPKEQSLSVMVKPKNQAILSVENTTDHIPMIRKKKRSHKMTKKTEKVKEKSKINKPKTDEKKKDMKHPAHSSERANKDSSNKEVSGKKKETSKTPGSSSNDSNHQNKNKKALLMMIALFVLTFLLLIATGYYIGIKNCDQNNDVKLSQTTVQVPQISSRSAEQAPASVVFAPRPETKNNEQYNELILRNNLGRVVKIFYPYKGEMKEFLVDGRGLRIRVWANKTHIRFCGKSFPVYFESNYGGRKEYSITKG